MAEDPDIVDSVTAATNGIGSEALAAISNLGGGSGSIATGVVSRIGATVSGQAGGFAPKAITTITKHGLAAIDRVEPIRGVERGYRAVARDANGLESIRTVLDLDPREYDVTVTREDGVAIVEFVQQEPNPEPALPSGEDEVSEAPATSPASSATTPEPMAPVKDASPADRRDDPAATGATTTQPRPLGTDGSGHAQHAAGGPTPVNGAGREVERTRAEAEKTKARAEAEKAQAEAEKAKAEAAAAKARAEAEKAEAEADTEAVRGRQQPTEESTDSRHTNEQPRSTRTASGEPERQRGGTERTGSETAFSASRELDSGFEAESSDAAETSETAGGWGLREEPNGPDEAGDDAATGTTSDEHEADARDDAATGTASDEHQAEEGDELGDEGGFGGFSPATPVEDEPPEYADGGPIETSISVHEDGGRDAVADGGTDDSDEDTGKFQF